MNLGSIGSMIGIHRRDPYSPVQPTRSHNAHGSYHTMSIPFASAAAWRGNAALDGGVKIDAPVFMASAHFAGRRSGYKYEVGDRGLGYYVDPVQAQSKPRTVPRRSPSKSPSQRHCARGDRASPSRVPSR